MNGDSFWVKNRVLKCPNCRGFRTPKNKVKIIAYLIVIENVEALKEQPSRPICRTVCSNHKSLKCEQL